MNLLFVCSKNKWRSRTAETIFKNTNQLWVKSAGTDTDARVKLTQDHLSWATKILVMEHKHADKIRTKFGLAFVHKIEVLEISDDYQYMDRELIELLKKSVTEYL